DETGVITAIEPRKNYIIRKATKLSKQSHIIAANVDQALLITTIVQPHIKLGFVDRFLVTAEAYRIPVILVFNKLDLHDPGADAVLDTVKAIYEPIGYRCVATSALRGDHIDTLTAVLKDKVSLLSGHSGVGKSSLINAIDPTLDLRTADVSDFNEKGRHTTTFAEMFPLQEGGYIIDTPGLKSFGLLEMEKSELAHYFPEMYALLPECRFYNCTHTNEPGCAVKEAVEEEAISPYRYESYLNLYYEESPGS
ncbi:MAG: ribosome small subunit-dependent GTPase A, partial [Bacteroidota bacterium]